MKREIEPHLYSYLTDQSRETLIIEGARQVGKSYLVNRVLKSSSTPYIAFDLEKEPKVRRQIDETEDFFDFESLLRDRYQFKNNTTLFIDEAQESNRLAHYIRFFKENWPKNKVILTGSSMNRLFSGNVRYPVGRTKSVRVFPFSFSEFTEYVKGEGLADFVRAAPLRVPQSRHRMLLELFDDYIQTGGYPEAVAELSRGRDYRSVLNEIIYNLEEDFQRKENYKPELFRNALKAVANHIGSLSKLGQFGTTKYFAEKIITSMKAWHIFLEVELHSFDPNRSHFLPKRYLHDLGVINLRRSLTIPQISIIETIDPILRTPLGGIFENAVLLSIVQGESAGYSVGGWKKGNNTDIEVDFIFDLFGENIKIPIECKAAVSVKRKHYKNLLHYLELSHQNIGFLVSAAPIQKIIVGKKVIINIPVYLATKNNFREYYTKFRG